MMKKWERHTDKRLGTVYSKGNLRVYRANHGWIGGYLWNGTLQNVVRGRTAKKVMSELA